MQIEQQRQLIGTFSPLLGLLLVIFVARAVTGVTRWCVLFIRPLLVLIPCYMFAKNMMNAGDTVFATIMGFVLFGLIIYYPIFGMVAAFVLFKHYRKQ